MAEFAWTLPVEVAGKEDEIKWTRKETWETNTLTDKQGGRESETMGEKE
jgi:hypothetical protein